MPRDNRPIIGIITDPEAGRALGRAAQLARIDANAGVNEPGLTDSERAERRRLGRREYFARLGRAGYRLAPVDHAWAEFSTAHATYAPGLEAMANYWAVPPASWFGVNEPMSSPTHRREDVA